MAKPLMSDQMVDEVSQFFGALSDPSRLRLLRALLDVEGPLSQGALSEKTGLSQANASKHLMYLVRVGLVARTPDGNSVLYRIATPMLEQVCDLVCGHVSERIKATFQALKGE